MRDGRRARVFETKHFALARRDTMPRVYRARRCSVAHLNASQSAVARQRGVERSEQSRAHKNRRETMLKCAVGKGAAPRFPPKMTCFVSVRRRRLVLQDWRGNPSSMTVKLPLFVTYVEFPPALLLSSRSLVRKLSFG